MPTAATGKFKTAYGCKVPAKASPLEIELGMYRWNERFMKQSDQVWPANEHFINAVRMLWTNEQLTWSSWTEEHANCFVNEDFSVIWGPGSASKSNDFGAFVVADWWADPLGTYTAVCSTTAPMLKKRIWEAIQRYHAYGKGVMPGRHFASEHAITLDKHENESGAKKAGIHGFAVLAGTEEETKANIVGVHLPRVRLLVDEMQSTRKAAVDARHNLSKGARDSFKFFGLCNPDSFLNIAGEYSEPLDGWDTISVESEYWKTKWGSVYHYDGHKSPAVLEEGGIDLYPYLINQPQIDDHAKEGTDSADYWIYVRGFPPPAGVNRSVMCEADCIAYDIYETTKWRGGKRIISATLDPAFGGTDKACLKIWDNGYALDGRFKAELVATEYLEIKVSSPRPPTYQISDQVKAFAQLYGYKPEHFAIDESVTQTVGEVIMEEWEGGEKIHRVDFGSKPMEGLVSITSSKRCEDEYKNMISSMYFQFAEYCRNYQICNLDKKTARDFCTRLKEEGKPWAIEPKKDFRKRMGKSPDDGDAGALQAYIMRVELGIIPGSMQSVGAGTSISDEVAKHFDIDGSDSNYVDTSL